MTKALTQKRHVNLTDYELTTTLGTGKSQIISKQSFFLHVNRFIWSSPFVQKQEEWGVLRYEAVKESRHHQASSSGSCYF